MDDLRAHRIENIQRLLETYRDAIESFARDGEGATDEMTLRWFDLKLPKWYREGSYRELEHVLRRLYLRAPELHWHVKARFIDSERRTRTLRKDGFGKWIDVDTRRSRVVWAVRDVSAIHANRYQAIVETWHVRVEPVLVKDALRLMERVWRGPVNLPKDLREYRPPMTDAA